MEIKGLTALVTGGASGLGQAVVEAFVAAGANVAILDLNEQAGKALAKGLGEQALFHKTNVTDEDSVKSAIAATIECFGSIQVVVNAAGVAAATKVLGRDGVMPLEAFRKVVDINLIGTFNVLRLAAEQMATNTPNDDGERGVIINTASVAAFEGQVGQAAYSASKNAVVGLALPIAREFAAHGIRVNTIAPGVIETPMASQVPQAAIDGLIEMVQFPKRLGRPEEFADLALTIVRNAYLNAECIRLDAAIRFKPR